MANKVYDESSLEVLFRTLAGPAPELAGITLGEAARIAGVLGVDIQRWDEVRDFFGSPSVVWPLSEEETVKVLDILNAPDDPDPAPAVDPDPDPDPVPARKSSNWTLWVLRAVLLVCALVFFVVIGKFFLSLPDKSSEIVPAATPTVQVIDAVVVQPTLVAPIAVPVQPTAVPVQPTPVQPTAVPVVAVPTMAATVSTAGGNIVVLEADSVFHYNGGTPAYSDFRAAVREPGDSAVFVWNFDVPLDNAVIRRVWPDDMLVSATLMVPGQDPKDITSLFEMFMVPAGGTGDASLDVVLKERGVNVADGEILMQNKYAVFLGNVPAGSKIVFEIKDDAKLAVNRGIGVVVDQTVDAFTVPLK